jgi:hypothetical protein
VPDRRIGGDAVLRLQPRQYMRRYAAAAPTLAAVVTDEKGLNLIFRVLRFIRELCSGPDHK